MKTIDGKSYSYVTTDFRDSFVPTFAEESPLIIFKSPRAATPVGFFPPFQNSPPLVLAVGDNPIIPISFSVAVVRAVAAPIQTAYAFKTAFIVNIPAPVVSAGYVFATGANSKYAGKLGPYATVNESALKATAVNQPKQWYGDIALRNWDKIPFHSGDFIYPNPAFFVPTDTAYWYQNYITMPTPAATAPSSQTSGLSNYQLTIGQVYSRTAVLEYLMLN